MYWILDQTECTVSCEFEQPTFVDWEPKGCRRLCIQDYTFPLYALIGMRICHFHFPVLVKLLGQPSSPSERKQDPLVCWNEPKQNQLCALHEKLMS